MGIFDVNGHCNANRCNMLLKMGKMNRKSDAAQQIDLNKADAMHRFVSELKFALKCGVHSDYVFDGEDEHIVETFDEDQAIIEVIKLLKKYGLIPDVEHDLRFNSGISLDKQHGWDQR